MLYPFRVAQVLVVAALSAWPAVGQPQVGGVIRKVQEKAKGRSDQIADEAAQKAITAVEGAIRCLVTDLACIRRAREAKRPVTVTDSSGKPVSSADSAAALVSAGGAQASSPFPSPGEGAWANYDFVPGERVLFYLDFAADAVGDFPRRLEFVSGNLEVVEWQGGRYLRNIEGNAGRFVVPLPEVLPARFTVEIEYAGPGSNNLALYFADHWEAGQHNSAFFRPNMAGLLWGAARGQGGPDAPIGSQFFVARLMADGRYAKVYLNEKRVANVPNANLGRASRIQIELPGGGGLIRSIRVAAGGRRLYDALAESGRAVASGILFDTGSDVLRPESTPTLKEMGEMLVEHPALRLRIEGHTDNVGDDAANQALSERRAAAVRQYLVTTYQVNPARLESAGLGETRPRAPNDTPEGRQNNRRVELVRP